jgi:uncharacterized protein YozE (UPF0346 family)
MNIELLINKANKEMERLSKIASSDNPDPSPSDINMANEEYDLLEYLLETHDYESLEEYLELDADKSQSIPRQMELDLQDCTHLPVWNV